MSPTNPDQIRSEFNYLLAEGQSARDAFDKAVPYFTLEEFERSQNAVRWGLNNRLPDNPPVNEIRSLLNLCQFVLVPVREIFLKPVIITSGYRAPAVNSRAGGAKKSQHTLGEAADIRVVGVDPLEVCHAIADHRLPFDQLIFEGSWTHVSYSSRHRRQVLTAKFIRTRNRKTGSSQTKTEYHICLPALSPPSRAKS